MCSPKLLCLPPVANTLRDLDMRFTWVTWLLVYGLVLSSDNHTTPLKTITFIRLVMNITIWKRTKKYYYNILRVLMTTFIIILVAILYS